MKRSTLILIALAVVLAAGLIAMVLLRTKLGSEVTSNRSTTTNQVGNQNAAVVSRPSSNTPEAQDRDAVTALAILFAERFGSYSTETLAANGDRVAPFATTSAQIDVQNFIRQEQAKYAGSGLSVGITSRALTTTIAKYRPAAAATVDVGLQRREEASGAAATVRQQTLQLEIIKQGEAWKVNRLTWK